MTRLSSLTGGSAARLRLLAGLLSSLRLAATLLLSAGILRLRSALLLGRRFVAGALLRGFSGRIPLHLRFAPLLPPRGRRLVGSCRRLSRLLAGSLLTAGIGRLAPRLLAAWLLFAAGARLLGARLTALLRRCFLPPGLAGGVARTLLITPLAPLGGLLRAAAFARLRAIGTLSVRLTGALHRLIGPVRLAAALRIRLLGRLTRLRPWLIAQRIGRLLRIGLRSGGLAVGGCVPGLGARGICCRLLLAVSWCGSLAGALS